MARTNWGPIILGMGLLGGGIYVVVKWKEICPKIMSADKCADGPLGWFDSPVGSAVGGGIDKINSIGGGGADTVAKNVVTRGQASRKSGAAIVGSNVSRGWTTKPVGSAIVGGSRYTNAVGSFNSFNTFTLNRLSVG